MTIEKNCPTISGDEGSVFFFGWRTLGFQENENSFETSCVNLKLNRLTDCGKYLCDDDVALENVQKTCFICGEFGRNKI